MTVDPAEAPPDPSPDAPAPAQTGRRAGTVTFLFTDIEGSTRLVQALGDRYASLLAEHHAQLRQAFEAAGGTQVDASGDGLFYAFPTARAGLTGAITGQRALAARTWPDGVTVRDRMGLHTGEPVSGEVGYVGIDVHRAARISAAGHGGQILVSQTARDLMGGDLPADARLVDLGAHRLKDLAAPERLFQVVADGLAQDFPALRSIDARPNNLPRQLTSFVGRQSEVGEVKRILATAPLVTLTGPGGVGKTRLAIEVAGDLLEGFEGGAWFVELASLSDPAFVLQAVGSALGVGEEPGRPLLSTLVEHLQGHETLILLDNCEQVIGACAEIADALLRACPGVRMLATSREGLGIPGEALFPVPSLSLPSVDRPGVEELGQFDSVRLFAERAMAASPAFRVTSANGVAIAQICRRLDGVPLAIELAAARVRALTPDQIAGRLDDRFRLLTGSSRISVPRHQTLRATIDWSYELLADDERAVLRRLSVFAPSCSLEAAETVCSGEDVAEMDVLDLLSRLVDKSLLVAEAEGQGRYRLLETIRQYARDRLLESGEATEALRRHRDWYLALAEQAAPEFFRGIESRDWLERLEVEHDNLRAALQWSEDEPGEATAGLRLAAAFWRFWEIRGYLIEGRTWLERMLAATASDTSVLRANALTGAGILAYMQGDYAAASALHEQSLELHRRLGDRNAIAYAANNLANVAVLRGDYAQARELYELGVRIAREMGDDRGAAFGLMNMAEVVAQEGDAEGARRHFEQSIATFRRFGDRWGEAFALDNFGLVTCRQRQYDAARELHDQALGISRELGDQRGIARALTHLADVAAERGETPEAMALLRESLAIRRALGDVPGVASAMEKVAWVLGANDPGAAARLLGCAEALRESIRAHVPPVARSDYEAGVGRLVAAMGAEAFSTARQEGHAKAPDEILATLPL
ncbi:MAG TPA: tetratricopeptide repeat protein [Candidatus Limnocylindrales bacterium]